MNGASFLAFALALVGCATAQPQAASSTSTCPDFGTDVERVWGVDAKARVQASAAQLGVEFSATNVEGVTYKLDQISRDWAQVSARLCRDYASGRIDRTEYAERSRCLDDSLIRMRTFVTMLQSGGLRDPAMLQASSDRMAERQAACGKPPSETATQAQATAETRGVQFVPATAALPTAGMQQPVAAALPEPAEPVSAIDARARSLYAHSIAVVIGIDDYQYLPDLRAGESDANAVADELRARGFQVALLLGAEATRDRIASLLGDELPRRLVHEDRVLVFFAGHGVSVDEGERAMGYLMPWGGKRELPVATGISMTELQAWLGAYSAKHVMFVADACYSGLALPSRSVNVERSAQQLLRMAAREPVRFTLVAGQDNQEAWEMNDQKRGTFTYFFLRALDGDADENGDHLITATEIASYVSSRVFSYVSQQHGREQRPISASSGRGEFIFLAPDAAMRAGAP